MLVAMPVIFRGIGLDQVAPGHSFFLPWMILGFLIASTLVMVSLGRQEGLGQQACRVPARPSIHRRSILGRVSKFGLVFVILLFATGLTVFARPARSADSKQLAPGVAANERVTALTGALLFICLVGLALSVLFVPRLLPVHYLVGFLTIPPIAVKLATTGYRFVRYYMRDPRYRAAGAPPLMLRFVVAPLLVISTVVVVATGVELWLFGVRFGTWWTTAHTVSAVVFMAAAVLHLLSHLRRSSDAVIEELATPGSRRAFESRSIVIASLLAGSLLAAASLLYATPFGSFGG